MRRLGASVLIALTLAACLDLGSSDPVAGEKVGTGGAAGDASASVEGGCWQAQYADCDGVKSNGCETALNTLQNCGACGKSCSVPSNGTASCTAGSCKQSCDSGYENCDNDWSNGCESLTTTQNCGSCGLPCAGTCNAGTCCKPEGSACTTGSECCVSECTGGRCCRSAMSDCTAGPECCVGYCISGTCCKPSGVACNQNGTCCSGSCVSGSCA